MKCLEHIYCSLRLASKKKRIMAFFLLNFLPKFIDMYGMDTVLFFILLVFEMLKIPKINVEVHFLKKLDFVTNKCLAQDAFRKCPRTTENLLKHTALQLSQYIVMCTDFLIILYILQSYLSKRTISVNEMHCPYKQSLS